MTCRSDADADAEPDADANPDANPDAHADAGTHASPDPGADAPQGGSDQRRSRLGVRHLSGDHVRDDDTDLLHDLVHSLHPDSSRMKRAA